MRTIWNNFYPRQQKHMLTDTENDRTRTRRYA
jgi:hypothetical protein